MLIPLTQRRDWERRPSATCTPATTALAAGTTEVNVTVGGDVSLASLADRLAPVRGLWLNGTVTPDDLRAAAQLPALVELHVRTTLTRAHLEALARRRFDRLLLSFFDGAAVDAVAALDVGDLALAVSSDASAEAWAKLFGMKLERLHIKGARSAIPAAAIEAMARTATARWLTTSEVSYSAEAIEALGAVHSLEFVSLATFGAPGRVRIAGSRGLRELELLTTNVDAVELESLPSLEYIGIQHTSALTLRDLPRLSFVPLSSMGRNVALTIDGLPALEQIFPFSTNLASVSVQGAPRLHRVDFRDVTNTDVLAAAPSLAPDVIVASKRAKAKKVGEKRKVKWANPKLGLDAVPRGALIAGRVAVGRYSAGRAKDLGTVGEWWAQQLGVHVTSAMPQMLDEQDVASALVFGRVLALVGPKEREVCVAVTPSMLADAAASLTDVWAEAAGVLGDDALFERPFGLYLVACGAGAFAAGDRIRIDQRWHAALSTNAGAVGTVDVLSLPWRGITLPAEEAEVRLAMKEGGAFLAG